MKHSNLTGALLSSVGGVLGEVARSAELIWDE